MTKGNTKAQEKTGEEERMMWLKQRVDEDRNGGGEVQ